MKYSDISSNLRVGTHYRCSRTVNMVCQHGCRFRHLCRWAVFTDDAFDARESGLSTHVSKIHPCSQIMSTARCHARPENMDSVYRP